MKRMGAKNQPVYRIVVADARSPRDGKFIEELGAYRPLVKGDNFNINLERAQYWLSVGARPSDTVASFIKKALRAPAVVPVVAVPAPAVAPAAAVAPAPVPVSAPAPSAA
jgi:small subunit ribosomal protein S16